MFEPAMLKAGNRFFPRRDAFSVLGESSGFSGSSFARVEASGTSWCLRRWPDGFKEQRLRFIHKTLLHSRANGFSGVPTLARTDEGNTVLEINGHLFDAQEWLAGKPLSRSSLWQGAVPNVVRPLPASQFENLVYALALFHSSVTDLRLQHTGGRGALSWHLRKASEDAKVREDLRIVDGARTRRESSRVARLWLELLPRAAELAEESLRRHPEAANDASTLCHGDLWASHIYFLRSSFVGLIDFESLCFSSPSFDLAQLILHFNGWDQHEVAINAYERIRPLGESNRAVLWAAAALDLMNEGCWSLTNLYGESGEQLQEAQVRAHEFNLHRMLESLESLVNEFDQR